MRNIYYSPQVNAGSDAISRSHMVSRRIPPKEAAESLFRFASSFRFMLDAEAASSGFVPCKSYFSKIEWGY
jgi:hypothetical protein